MRDSYIQNLIRKPQGKRARGRSKCELEHNSILKK